MREGGPNIYPLSVKCGADEEASINAQTIEPLAKFRF
jgi:hypothetical protein